MNEIGKPQAIMFTRGLFLKNCKKLKFSFTILLLKERVGFDPNTMSKTVDNNELPSEIWREILNFENFDRTAFDFNSVF